MYTPKNHQSSINKKYYSMSYKAINLIILSMINNYTSYNIRVFFRVNYTV